MATMRVEHADGAGAQDGHRLARGDLGQIVAAHGDRERLQHRPHLETHVVGDREHLALAVDAVLGKGARIHGVVLAEAFLPATAEEAGPARRRGDHSHPLPHLVAKFSGAAHLDDGAGGLVALDLREAGLLDQAERAFEDLDVGAADPGVGDLDFYLIWLRHRFGDVFDLDNIDGFLNSCSHDRRPHRSSLADRRPPNGAHKIGALPPKDPSRWLSAAFERTHRLLEPAGDSADRSAMGRTCPSSPDRAPSGQAP